MKSARSKNRTRTVFALILLLGISAISLFVPAYTASNLGIVPDSVEYATAAWRLVNEGRYVITINGEAYPPRYPPGFALVALAPAWCTSSATSNVGVSSLNMSARPRVKELYVVMMAIGLEPPIFTSPIRSFRDWRQPLDSL